MGLRHRSIPAGQTLLCAKRIPMVKRPAPRGATFGLLSAMVSQGSCAQGAWRRYFRRDSTRSASFRSRHGSSKSSSTIATMKSATGPAGSGWLSLAAPTRRVDAHLLDARLNSTPLDPMLIHTIFESQPRDRRHHSPELPRRIARCVHEKPVVIYFHAPQMPECQAMTPQVEALVGLANAAVTLAKVDMNDPSCSLWPASLPCAHCPRWCCSIRDVRMSRPFWKGRRMKPHCASISPPLPQRGRSCCSIRQSRRWRTGQADVAHTHLGQAHRLAPSVTTSRSG